MKYKDTKEMRHDFTVQERYDIHEAALKLKANRDVIAANYRDARETFKFELKAADLEIGELEEKLTQGFEPRPMDVLIDYRPKDKQKDIYSLDGVKLLTEPMSPADFHLALIGTEPDSRGESEDGSAPAAQEPQPNAAVQHFDMWSGEYGHGGISLLRTEEGKWRCGAAGNVGEHVYDPASLKPAAYQKRRAAIKSATLSLERWLKKTGHPASAECLASMQKALLGQVETSNAATDGDSEDAAPEEGEAPEAPASGSESAPAYDAPRSEFLIVWGADPAGPAGTDGMHPTGCAINLARDAEGDWTVGCSLRIYQQELFTAAIDSVFKERFDAICHIIGVIRKHLKKCHKDAAKGFEKDIQACLDAERGKVE